ncbi:hypothetical protein BN871_DH_00570 [Paenibacillus sp. P22]|nr:hypothetical protein BN871_DH_00570 [Paenibacillus sp. P22]
MHRKVRSFVNAPAYLRLKPLKGRQQISTGAVSLASLLRPFSPVFLPGGHMQFL